MRVCSDSRTARKWLTNAESSPKCSFLHASCLARPSLLRKNTYQTREHSHRVPPTTARMLETCVIPDGRTTEVESIRHCCPTRPDPHQRGFGRMASLVKKHNEKTWVTSHAVVHASLVRARTEVLRVLMRRTVVAERLNFLLSSNNFASHSRNRSMRAKDYWCLTVGTQ